MKRGMVVKGKEVMGGGCVEYEVRGREMRRWFMGMGKRMRRRGGRGRYEGRGREEGRDGEVGWGRMEGVLNEGVRGGMRRGVRWRIVEF